MKFEGSWRGIGVSTIINFDGTVKKLKQNIIYEIKNLGDNAYSIFIYNINGIEYFTNELLLGGYIDKRTNTLTISDYSALENLLISDNIIYFNDNEIYNSFNLFDFNFNYGNTIVFNLKLTKNCIIPPKNKKITNI